MSFNLVRTLPLSDLQSKLHQVRQVQICDDRAYALTLDNQPLGIICSASHYQERFVVRGDIPLRSLQFPVPVEVTGLTWRTRRILLFVPEKYFNRLSLPVYNPVEFLNSCLNLEADRHD